MPKEACAQMHETFQKFLLKNYSTTKSTRCMAKE